MTAPGGLLSVVGFRSVLDVLEGGVREHPDRVLLVYDDVDANGDARTFTWREVLDRSLAAGAFLRSRGLARGGRVHVHLPNRPEFLFTWFGCAALGASMVPTNTQSSADEVAYAIDHSGCEISVTDRAGEALVRRAVASAGGRRQVIVCEDDDLLGASGAEVPADARPAPADDLGLLYTSGTTSRPKAVRVTHANYVYAGEVVARNIRLSPDDRILTVLPLFHANAQYYTTMGALVSRATLVLASRFSASRVLDQAVDHDITVMSLFAAPIRMILAQPARPRWREHRVRVVLFAQNLTDEEVARWDDAVGAPLLQLYGMTETIGPPLMNPIDDARRPSSIGRPSLGYTCRVVCDDGRPAEVGDIGQLWVHGVPGVSLMRGYLGDPEATAAAISDGWLKTGDVVRIEPDGHLTFVDRRKDMIKRGGENVAASEVESVLLRHPSVADAAVFGVPDPIRDEQIVAAVVPAPGEDPQPDALIAWCAERLAKFRVPSHVLVVSELPRTAVGKIQKHVLHQQWVERSAS